jgi:hypothetical protein
MFIHTPVLTLVGTHTPESAKRRFESPTTLCRQACMRGGRSVFYSPFFSGASNGYPLGSSIKKQQKCCQCTRLVTRLVQRLDRLFDFGIMNYKPIGEGFAEV